MRPQDGFRDPRDGAVYQVVRLGTLEWLGRNLSYVAEQSWCYGDRRDDCDVHGRLYPWEKATKACPPGWRLPSDDDWNNLEMVLGMTPDTTRMERARGTTQGVAMQKGGASGLNVLMSGYRRPDGAYVRRGERAAFWTASATNDEDAWHRDVRADVGTIYRSPVTKTYALSVRCVR